MYGYMVVMVLALKYLSYQWGGKYQYKRMTNINEKYCFECTEMDYEMQISFTIFSVAVISTINNDVTLYNQIIIVCKI